MRTREDKLEYAKGYAAGSKGAWPVHRPPLPPDKLIADLMKTASELRDGVDCELAKFDEEDEVVVILGPLVDSFDAVMIRVTEWLRQAALGP